MNLAMILVLFVVTQRSLHNTCRGVRAEIPSRSPALLIEGELND